MDKKVVTRRQKKILQESKILEEAAKLNGHALTRGGIAEIRKACKVSAHTVRQVLVQARKRRRRNYCGSVIMGVPFLQRRGNEKICH